MLLSIYRSTRAFIPAAASRASHTGGFNYKQSIIVASAAAQARVIQQHQTPQKYQHQHHHHQQQQQQQQQYRHFGKKIIDIRRSEQRSVWSSYLAGSVSDRFLFSEIDLNKSGTITVEEISYFMDSVSSEGVDEKKFDLLMRLGNDHELDEDDFRLWLRVATDVKSDGSDFKMNESDDSSSSSDSDNEDYTTQTKKVIDARRGLQQTIWETFLATGTGAPDLFKMIDLNRSSKICVSEIMYFVDSIHSMGVSHGKLVDLRKLGGNHELSEEEFYEWLAGATGVELTEEGECEGMVDDESHRGGADGCTPGQW